MSETIITKQVTGKAARAVRAVTAATGKTLAVVVAVFTVAASLGRMHWVFDMATGFPHLYLALGLAGIACLVAVRAWRWAVVLAVLSAANAGAVAPWLTLRPGTRAEQAPHLRVLSANLRRGQADVAAFADLVRRERPDVIALQEVTPEWAGRVEALLEEYPYRVVAAEADAMRPALFSRHPLKNERVFWVVPDTCASIWAEIEVDGREVTVLATHALAPQRGEQVRLRNATFDRLPELLGTVRGALLVVGDLNATMWSPHFARMAVRAGLANAREGIGIRSTWPAGYAPLMLPLDHCLYRGPLKAVSCRTAPNPGSDHLSLIVDFVWTE